MAAPHLRHQNSLEGFVNLSSSPPLPANIRTQADHRFQEIMERFRDRDPDRSSKYDRPKLINLIYRYAISQKSRDNILRAVFRALELPIEGDAVDFSTETALLLRLIGFADHLVDNFFMPCTLKRSYNRVRAFTCLVLTDSITVRALTAKTPQPTPHYRSATLRSSSKDFVGTPERLSTLRGDCLVRDKHRCVISRVYDKTRAEKQAAADVMLDDDQRPIKDGKFAYLEVAHIMPHSLVQVGSDLEELNEARKTALEILNMFDNDIDHRINGTDINRPFNALTLTLNLHRAFGNFEVYFTSIRGREHTYEISTFQRTGFTEVALPVVRTLHLTEDRNIEPPSPQLLAVHRAIAHILHLSGAGRYIDRIVDSMNEQQARSDGSTDLGSLVRLRAQAWIAGGVYM
ncbi:hypothetical protein MAC_04000 [Metarhizium acridum CQMa 102]|uniref:HNH nuclease domain-containing protein n=1 Tax=Metarhizium acridum (strain CQMa 102) TaxID=655827 RepID=E9E2A2_METAQ|nr:uncharacterized protein MAC_04000 [Metarhizium acridum CQMa 102]EFY90018.1 hypothetical protein MAC_04000 [Metarhizium acridum CQMa 102]